MDIGLNRVWEKGNIYEKTLMYIDMNFETDEKIKIENETSENKVDMKKVR